MTSASGSRSHTAKPERQSLSWNFLGSFSSRFLWRRCRSPASAFASRDLPRFFKPIRAALACAYCACVRSQPWSWARAGFQTRCITCFSSLMSPRWTLRCTISLSCCAWRIRAWIPLSTAPPTGPTKGSSYGCCVAGKQMKWSHLRVQSDACRETSSEIQGQIVGRTGKWGERRNDGEGARRKGRRKKNQLFLPPSLSPPFPFSFHPRSSSRPTIRPWGSEDASHPETMEPRRLNATERSPHRSCFITPRNFYSNLQRNVANCWRIARCNRVPRQLATHLF